MKNLSENIEEQTGQRREQGRKRTGMTLVETVVAVAVLAIFSTGACKLLLSHRRISDMARAHYTAINIAKNRLELVRTFDFDQVANFIEDKVVVDASGVPSTVGNYRRTTQISAVSDNLLELTVTVDLRNRQTLAFTPAKEVLNTYLAKYLEPGGGTAPPPPSP